MGGGVGGGKGGGGLPTQGAGCTFCRMIGRIKDRFLQMLLHFSLFSTCFRLFVLALARASHCLPDDSNSRTSLAVPLIVGSPTHAPPLSAPTPPPLNDPSFIPPLFISIHTHVSACSQYSCFGYFTEVYIIEFILPSSELLPCRLHCRSRRSSLVRGGGWGTSHKRHEKCGSVLKILGSLGSSLTA